MHTTKQKILTAIKTQGGLTTGELSKILGISTTAVRRHLTNLEAQGLLHHRREQRGLGRPSFVYELTERAQQQFPQRYAEFALDLLQEIQAAEGDEEIIRLFRRSAQRRLDRYRPQIQGDSLPRRLATLIPLLEEEGQMPTWEEASPGQFLLRQHHCPLLKIAQHFPQVCDVETWLLGELLQVPVVRRCHILQGDSACVYEIGNGKRAPIL
ncbi:MAG: transcriptional regulator [Chloroflexi bacterium]|nr:MAG: transcriptional regulator [Chloroflexota bacterium]